MSCQNFLYLEKTPRPKLSDKRRALKVTAHLRQVKQALITADLHLGQALKAMSDDEFIDLDLEEYRLHLHTLIDNLASHL